MALSDWNRRLLERQFASLLSRTMIDNDGLPLPLSMEQKEQMKLTFFAGARAFYRAMEEVPAEGAPTLNDMRVAMGLIEELDALVPDMHAGTLIEPMPNGDAEDPPVSQLALDAAREIERDLSNLYAKARPQRVSSIQIAIEKAMKLALNRIQALGGRMTRI